MQVLDELARLEDDGLADELREADQDLRRAQARKAAAVAATQIRVEAMGYRESGAAETVAAITAVSTRSAHVLMDHSYAVCSRPAVWRALAEGRIDFGKATLIAESLIEVPDPDRDRLEAQAMCYAEDHTAFQTRRYLTRLLVDVQPELAEEEQKRRKAKAWDGRYIQVHARENGMADIYGYVPLGTAHLLLSALDDLAGTYKDDRTADQKRVDALTQIVAESVKLDVRVDVVIPADTLAGLKQTGASVIGFGAVDGEFARTMALRNDARWRRLVTDPVKGTLLDLSAKTYRIPPRLKELVRARDRYCRFPGCSTEARHTDTDHVRAWPHGPTSATNLGPGCRTHHRVKTHSAWKCRMNDDGSMTWTSPLGTEHTTYPWDYNNPTM